MALNYFFVLLILFICCIHSSQIKAALLLVTSFTRAYAELEKSTHMIGALLYPSVFILG